MKKRYARILAATLSAAMVFTSAPVNFTGINTGVIEAQAADKTASVDAALKAEIMTKLQEAINTTYVEFNGTKNYGNVITALQDEVTSLMSTKVSATAIALGTPGHASNVNAGEEALATITVTLKDGADAAAAAGDTVQLDASAKKAVIHKHVIADVNDTAVSFPSDLTLAKGTAAGADLSGISAATNGYTLTANGAKALADATGATAEVEIEKAFAAGSALLDSTNYDFTNLGTMFKAGATTAADKVVRTVTVKVAGKTVTTGDLKFDPSNMPTVAEIDWGGTGAVVKKSSTPLNTWSIKASEIARVSTMNAATPAVTVTIESAVHDAAGIDWAGYTTGSVNYNEATQRYEKTVPLTINQKTINEIDLVWPTELAAGETVAIGDDLTTKKLVETESKKYGEFKIAGQGDTTTSAYSLSTTAVKGTNKIAVEFKPNDNCTLGSVRNTDSVKTLSTPNRFGKIKVFNIEIAKSVIADDKIAIKAKDTYDANAIEYGAKIGDVMKSTNFTFAGAANGTYALKTGTTVADVLPVGKTTLTYVYTLTDTDNYELSNGKTTKEVTVDVNVVKPVVKAAALAGGKTFFSAKKSGASQAITATVTGYDSNGKDANGTLGASNSGGTYLHTSVVDYSYQWYITENGSTTALRGETGASYTPSTSVVGTAKYYCVITTKVKDSATAAQKAVLASVLAPSYTSEPCTFTIGEFEATITDLTGGSKLTYGYVQASTAVELNGTDYSNGSRIKTAKWSYIDGDKVSHDIATSEINATKKVSTVTIPTGLAAGDYTLVCELTVADKDGKENTCPIYGAMEVDKKGLADAAWNEVTIEKVKVTYGAKLSDIKIKAKDGADAYGTYTWVDPDYTLAAGTYNALQLRAIPEAAIAFVPSKDTKNNYYKVASPNEFTVDEYAATITAADVTVDKATLTVKPADVTVAVNGKVDVTDVQTVATGLVGNDTLGSLRVKVSYKLADTIDTTKAGTIADAIIASATVTKNGTVTDVVKTNRTTLLDNYNIDVANGSVIVKGAAVAPSTAPTVAPTKAPAVKPAKSTYPVKAGKTVALKVKNAPKGAKVTWSVDKKAKKALKVSKKGKVTVKKGAKKGTYKVYAKVNGKKVTFKVKVK